MRLTTSVIAGFIAVGAATPAGLAVMSTSAKGSVGTVTAQPTPVDGNWHIGCDVNNYCSYYQDSDTAAGSSTDSLSPRTITLSEATCKQCTSQDPCSYCEDQFKFNCRDCDHYQCEDGYLRGQTHCFDIQPELAEVIRNHTGATGVIGVTATIYKTTTSTTAETSSIDLPTPASESTITITHTAATNIITHTIFAPRHSGLAPRKEAGSNHVDSQPPVRRNAAFKQSQCTPCNEYTCPECHNDCAECEKFLCNDLATHLTVCMSVRSKWQPPSFNISASSPSETTTVVVMPQPGTATTTQTVIYSTIISTISTPSVSTVIGLPTPSPPVVTVTVSAPTVSTTTVIVVPQVSTTTIAPVPQAPLISTVVVAPPRPQVSTVTVISQPPQLSTVTIISQPPQLSTVTVLPQPPRTSTVVFAPSKLQTNTISIQKSTVTVQKPASTIVYQQPGTTSIVTYHYQDPASTVVYQQPGTTSTVTYHYQDPASTVVIQPPTVTASRSPSVIEIPMTVITTATHTVARSVRAVHTPAPMSPRDSAMAKSTCDTCDGNLECDGCDFACDEDCSHFLCKDAVSGLELCLSVPEDTQASKAYDTSMSPSSSIGSAAMFLVLDNVEDPTSNTSASHLQPAVSNGTRPNFAFAEEDCYLCELDDESCGMCDWQFTCGTKKRCFHNGAREVVEMCFESGEKCRP
ncbi:hypothetical protein G6011_10721 [Alternaria panax]|uniref:Uncharacterized protein n=1 Tax=Alternaria panax TaxID=48097 RepID=A0AAD4ICH7_9PLEO|nr:hypothetical protein G6011_10721 [Alternaria panax]